MLITDLLFERDSTSVTFWTNAKCPGWILKGDKCYFISQGKYVYSKAVQLCAGKENGAKLAEPLNEMENRNILNILIAKNLKRLWIGVNDQDKEKK